MRPGMNVPRICPDESSTETGPSWFARLDAAESGRTTRVITFLFLCPNVTSKQLLDFMFPKIDQREGTAGGAGKGGVEIEAEALVDRGDDLGGLDGVFGRV